MGDSGYIPERLQKLGLSENEASIFLELLDGPKTPMEVSRKTGITRSNAYRIIDGLFNMGLLREHTTADHKLLAAADPGALELLVMEQEQRARDRRKEFKQLLPMLESMAIGDEGFGIKTYRGLSGLKQMLWNELRHTDDVLIFSSGPHERATGVFWADKFRAEVIARGIVQRSIENPSTDGRVLAQRKDYQPNYIPRYISPKVLPIRAEIAIHEKIVFMYNPWDQEAQLGTEINNPFIAAFMRQVWEHYWQLASPDPDLVEP